MNKWENFVDTLAYIGIWGYISIMAFLIVAMTGIAGYAIWYVASGN